MFASSWSASLILSISRVLACWYNLNRWRIMTYNRTRILLSDLTYGSNLASKQADSVSADEIQCWASFSTASAHWSVLSHAAGSGQLQQPSSEYLLNEAALTRDRTARENFQLARSTEGGREREREREIAKMRPLTRTCSLSVVCVCCI